MSQLFVTNGSWDHVIGVLGGIIQNKKNLEKLIETEESTNFNYLLFNLFPKIANIIKKYTHPDNSETIDNTLIKIYNEQLPCMEYIKQIRENNQINIDSEPNFVENYYVIVDEYIKEMLDDHNIEFNERQIQEKLEDVANYSNQQYFQISEQIKTPKNLVIRDEKILKSNLDLTSYIARLPSFDLENNFSNSPARAFA